MKVKLFLFLLPAFLWSCASPPRPQEESAMPSRPLAKNIVLIIGDGMGLTQLSAAGLRSKDPLSILQFPVVGLQTTSCSDDLITDSAAAATAMACGIKTKKFAVGVAQDSTPCTTILEQARSRGMATGIVVTSTIVHATPAAFYAHKVLRGFYEAIAADLVEANVDFLVGGGRQHFENRKVDGRDLLAEMRSKNYAIHDSREIALEAITFEYGQKFLYFTSEKDPVSAQLGRNYLPKASELAMQFLRNRGRKGFFLLIEGSQIDWAGHSNDAEMMVSEVLDLDRAVAKVMREVQRRDDTLVLVTADHETGGLAIKSDSKFGEINLGFISNEHTPVMVPVFAYGPGAELFSGVYDNTQIYVKMRQALGWE